MSWWEKWREEAMESLSIPFNSASACSKLSEVPNLSYWEFVACMGDPIHESDCRQQTGGGDSQLLGVSTDSTCCSLFFSFLWIEIVRGYNGKEGIKKEDSMVKLLFFATFFSLTPIQAHHQIQLCWAAFDTLLLASESTIWHAASGGLTKIVYVTFRLQS